MSATALALFKERYAAESSKRESKKARTAAIASASAGVPYAAQRKLRVKLIMLGVKPRDLPGADVLRAEFEWNAMLSDLTNRRNEFEVVLRERWDALDVKPKGNYSAKNSLTMATGEQLELLDELSIAYNASEAMSVYDAQQLFNACERVNGVSLSTATQLFFSFKIPLDEFISGDGDVAYTTLQFLIGQRKDAAEAEEEATPAESPPPPPPARAAAPKASSAPPNGRAAAGRR